MNTRISGRYVLKILAIERTQGLASLAFNLTHTDKNPEGGTHIRYLNIIFINSNLCLCLCLKFLPLQIIQKQKATNHLDQCLQTLLTVTLCNRVDKGLFIYGVIQIRHLLLDPPFLITRYLGSEAIKLGGLLKDSIAVLGI